jgi:hypothetical protein
MMRRILALVAFGLALTGCAAEEPETAALASPAPATATSEPMTPAVAATLDPKTACTRAVRLVDTATVDLIGGLVDHPDGTTIDKTVLATTIADMQLLSRFDGARGVSGLGRLRRCCGPRWP